VTQEERNQMADDNSARQFAQELRAKMKSESRAAGVTPSQALWNHHRLRELSVVIPSGAGNIFPAVTALEGQTLKIDLFNILVSGDLEIAYIALAFAVPDSMEAPYHWLSSNFIAMIRTEIGLYLGVE
jgi:hypothetical protein